MKLHATKSVLVALACGVLPLAAQERAQIVGEDLLPESSNDVSTNKIQKLVVKGKNARMRMAIASIANTMAKEFHMLLKQQEAYLGKRPIFFNMYEKGPAKGSLLVRPKVTPFEDNELVIELMVDTRKPVDRDVLAHGIIDILLYRKGLEGVKTLDDTQIPQVPPWLSHGLIEAIAWKNDSSRRRVYEHLLSNPDLFTLEKMFSSTGREVREFDATNETFFRAASCAFVLSLLRQEGGEQVMSDFIDEVVLFEGEVDILLRKHFPALSIGSNSIQKVWSLQVAEMAAPKLIETFSLVESDQRLNKLLMLNLPDEKGDAQLIPFENYRILDGMKVSEKVQATEDLRQGVIQLSNRCHPLYRPILLEYARLAAEVCKGELENIEQRLPLLLDERQKMIIADERCRDYLDWYQITRAHEVTGDFSGYMRLKERLSIEREERKDETIDPYLDKVQALMERDAP